MKIVVCGNYGAKNIGDEMILEGLLTTLKFITPKAKITILTSNPAETLKKAKSLHPKLNINAVKKFSAGIRSFLKSLFLENKTKKTVKKCDYFILGGGGLFGSLTFKANLIWGIQAYKAIKFKKPVIMYGQSIGFLKGRIRKWIVSRLFQKASFIAVRDEESKKRLQELGIHKEIYVMPDLAFRIRNVPRKKIINNNVKEAIVSLREFRKFSKEQKENIADFLKELIEKDWKIKIINFQKDIDEHLHKEIVKILKKKTKFKKEQIKILDIKNTDDLFKAYNKANLVLGMRLHSIITAIKTCTPFIAISYDSKIKDFLKDILMRNYMAEMSDLSHEKLKFLFSEFQKEQKILPERLEKINKELTEKYSLVEKKLLKIIR